MPYHARAQGLQRTLWRSQMREERKTQQYAWLFLPVAQELHAKNFVTRQAATRLAKPRKCAQKLRKCARSEMNRATLAKRPLPKCNAIIQEEEQRLSSSGDSEQNGQHTERNLKSKTPMCENMQSIGIITY